MPRLARLVIPGCPHHAVHRANRGEAIFLTPEHFRVYRRWLREYAAEHGLQVWAYCLMSNHAHLVAVPERDDSLSLAIGQAHMRYASWLNRTQGRSGHVWANRFHSAAMDGAHLWSAMRYVELNPVRAGPVARPEEYHWLSARAHVLGAYDPTLSGDLPLGAPQPGREWGEWLAAGLEEPTLTLIRRNTNTGRPTGSREFVAALEEKLGRRLSRRRPGPKKRE